MTFWQELAARLRVVFLALSVHALAAALIVLSTMNWQPFRKPQNLGLTIEAVMVNTAELNQQRNEARQAVEQQKLRQERDERLEQQRQREEDLKQQQDLQQQKELADEKLRQDELKAQRERDAREKQVNEEKLEAQRKLEAQEKLKKLRAEQERKAEEERKRKQTELEKLRAESEAAEKKRKLEAERLKQIENQRLNEQKEQQKRADEADLQKKLDAEAREFKAGQVAALSDRYQSAIQQFVTQNWLRPPTAQPGLRCKVQILQIPGGEVISASIKGSCNGDEATRRSIIAAVERGGSLPYRGYEDAFEREIEFTFIYDGD